MPRSAISATAAFLSDGNFSFKIKVLTHCLQACAQCSPQKLCRTATTLGMTVGTALPACAETRKPPLKPSHHPLCILFMQGKKSVSNQGACDTEGNLRTILSTASVKKRAARRASRARACCSNFGLWQFKLCNQGLERHRGLLRTILSTQCVRKMRQAHGGNTAVFLSGTNFPFGISHLRSCPPNCAQFYPQILFATADNRQRDSATD